MWRLADRQIDEFLADGECEFVSEYASPFTLLVIADLLGVPEADHDDVPRASSRAQRPRRAARQHRGETMAHKPLEFLYERFTAYIEDRRREPRDDVHDRARHRDVPRRLAARGRRRRCGSPPTCSPRAGDHGAAARARRSSSSASVPSCSSSCAPSATASRTSSRRRCGSRARSRATSGCRGCPTTVGGVDLPAGTTVMVLNGAANRDPRQFDDADRVPPRPRERAASTSRSGTASTPAPARRSPAPRPRHASSASSTA